MAEAEKLCGEEDVIAAFRRLQTLHDQWRNIGPVPKDVREEIRGRFKDLSADINKRYQAFLKSARPASVKTRRPRRLSAGEWRLSSLTSCRLSQLRTR